MIKPLLAVLCLVAFSSADAAQPTMRSATEFNIKADGVTDDSRNLQAAIAWAAQNNVRLLLPPGSIQLGKTTLAVPAGSQMSIEGAAGFGTSLVYTGSGTALTVGSAEKDTPWFSLRSVSVDCSTAAPGANGVSMARVLGGRVADLTIYGLSSGRASSGTGLRLDGTGYFAGLIAFDNITISGDFLKGFYSDGAVPNTSNAHSFTNFKVYRTTRRPNLGSIGFHWGYGSGDGWAPSVDCDSYDVCYQIDGRYLKGELRAERNAVAVNFGQLSLYNRLQLSGFDNATDLPTSWQPRTSYAYQYYVFSGSPVAIYRNSTSPGPCVSAAAGTGPTGTGRAIKDGTCVWAFHQLAGPPAWSARAYALGEMVSNGTPAQGYRCTRPGTSRAPGPTGTGGEIKDPSGAATWAWFGELASSPPMQGVGNSLQHAWDIQVNNTPGGSHVGETLLVNQGDGPLWLSLASAGSADQEVALNFEDRAGKARGRVVKSAGNVLQIDDGAGNTKMQFNATATGSTQVINALQQSRITLPYGKTILVNAALGNEFVVNVTNPLPFAFTAPANPSIGQRITFRIRNTTAAPLHPGDPFAAAAYKHSLWIQPMGRQSRAIDFQYDGATWVEVSRTPNDVPN